MKPLAGVTVVVEKREDPYILEACPFLSCQCSEEACSLSISFLTPRTINLSHVTVCTVLGVLFAYGCLVEGALAAASHNAT